MDPLMDPLMLSLSEKFRCFFKACNRSFVRLNAVEEEE